MFLSSFFLLHVILKSEVLPFILICISLASIKDLRSLTIQNTDTVRPEAINTKVTRSGPRTKEEGGGRSRVIAPERESFSLGKQMQWRTKLSSQLPGTLVGSGQLL